MDAATFSIGSFEDEPDDLSYWLNQSAEDRLAGIEFLRQQFFPYGEARQELRRFLEIVESPTALSTWLLGVMQWATTVLLEQPDISIFS